MTSRENQAIADYLNAGGVKHAISATTNGTHAKGSYHERYGTGPLGLPSKGLATDAVEYLGGGSDTAGLLNIWKVFSRVENQFAELIYFDAPYQIKNGKRVGPEFYGTATMAIHHNHVHAAVERGVYIKWPYSPPTPPKPPGPPKVVGTIGGINVNAQQLGLGLGSDGAGYVDAFSCPFDKLVSFWPNPGGNAGDDNLPRLYAMNQDGHARIEGRKGTPNGAVDIWVKWTD